MTAFVTDSFTDTNGTAISSHTGSLGATWTALIGNSLTPTIQSNALDPGNGAAANGLWYASGTPSSADYTATATIILGSGTNAIAGPGVRLSTSAQTGYFFFPYTSTTLAVYKYVAGTLTQVGSSVNWSPTAGASYALTLDASGTTISARVQRLSDSQWLTSAGTWQGSQVNCFSQTDSSISSAGRPGLWVSTQSSGQSKIDSFSADQAGGGATAITLNGPTSGNVGSPSTNFTVGANGTITGTVVVTPSDSSGGGTFSPTTVSISSGSPTGTFTYTAGSAGTKSISETNNGSLTDATPISYVASGSPVSVAVTDANWKFSPYNWATVSTTKVAVNGGAYFKLGFTGTSISIGLDVSSLVAASVSSSWYPSLRFSLDGGAQTDAQLTPSTTALSFSGLASGSHTIEVWYLQGWWENIGGTAPDRWTTPAYCVKVTGATIDYLSSTSAPVWLPNYLLWYGDSISEGIRANNSTTQPGNQNAYESVPAYVAQALGCELGNCSFGGQDYATGFNSIPAFNTAYSSVFNGQTRLSAGVLAAAPAYICIWQGANGAPLSADVVTAINNMRTIAPNARICVIVPIGGTGRSTITSAVSTYLSSNPTERKVHLIDLGSSWDVGFAGSLSKQSIDGLHPRGNWNARIGAAIAQKISALATLPATSRTLTVTLTTDGTTSAASLTGLKWAFWDQPTPDAMASPPSNYGTAATTNGSGVFSVTVNTTLASGGVGWLVVTNSDGTTTQSPAHKEFSGPVAVT